ncbi:UBC core domain-containing protein [Pleurotus pulmonarius]
MAPVTRRAAKLNHEPIVIHDSDSEPEVAEHQTKKRKLVGTTAVVSTPLSPDSEMHSEHDYDMAQIASSSSSSSGRGSIAATPAPPERNVAKNASLKGRRRFKADLADMAEECANGFVLEGLKLEHCSAGEDEGSFELTIKDIENKIGLLQLNVFVSDTSDYPSSHSVFAASSTHNLPDSVQGAIESIADFSPQPIESMISKLFMTLSRRIQRVKDQDDHEMSEPEEGSDDEDEYEGYESFDDDRFSSARRPEARPHAPLARINKDFVETVAAGYRPGFTRFLGGDYCISISLPIITLTEMIPPRALMAWDRRLLSRRQHLTLLISGFHGHYPPLAADGFYHRDATGSGTSIAFRVGLSSTYKASAKEAKEAFRTFGLVSNDIQESTATSDEAKDDGRFETFSLSTPLDTLLNTYFLKIIQLRIKFGLGWAAAELLCSLVEQKQLSAEDVYQGNYEAIREEDEEERNLGTTYVLPQDPLANLSPMAEFNLPLVAFSYLLRRIQFISRYCVVCHNKTRAQFEALKPYVCESKLCSYQYYAYNQGPSLEYEIIHNAEMVDLLVALAYSSAAEGVMDDPLPIGMALRVPMPARALPGVWSAHLPPVQANEAQEVLTPDENGLYDFDQLSKQKMRMSIAELINSLPSIEKMKMHLLQRPQPGSSKPKLKDLDPAILPAAWSILRWCVASCTAHLEELEGDNIVGNIDPTWRQFRFSVGAPDAEAKFKTAIHDAQGRCKNAKKFPTLYAFHGSPLKNWHSIIRHGLWYKEVTHGRAYGHGVYLAKDGAISMGYGQPTATTWRNSGILPSSCIALAEVVNVPKEFVSHNPYYVVKDTNWIMCRYLLVKGNLRADEESSPESNASSANAPPQAAGVIAPNVPIDPNAAVTLNNKAIIIPDPTFQIGRLVAARREEHVEEENDEEDQHIFNLEAESVALTQVLDSEPVPDWTPNRDYVRQAVANLMPPPLEASTAATTAIQRELRAMLKEQTVASRRPGGLHELGWFLPNLGEDDDNGGGGIMDNLFQWIVELHSFDESLPLTEQMKSKGINSLIFEIRFPPNFPHSPPFFRLLTPRFLGFSQGGGGHITLGGSICMDLLTADGWLPSYSISSVLLQIRLAISNLEPFPAKLSRDWDRPYGILEALDGYKRAAMTHGWKIPKGLDRLAR